MGISKDCQIFWVPPIISGTGSHSYELQILYAHLLAQSEQKPATNLG